MNWVEEKQAEKGPTTAGATNIDGFDIGSFELAQVFDLPLDQIAGNERYLDYVKEWAISKVDPGVPLTFLDIARGERTMLGQANGIKDFWAYLKLQEESDRLTERIKAFRTNG